MSIADFKINLDRLTRFKHPSVKYYRVYSDILSKFLIEPKFSSKQIELLEPNILVKLVEHVWNSSITNSFADTYIQNDRFIELLDSSIFADIDDYTKCLMSANLNITPLLLTLASLKGLPLNIKLLCELLNYNYTITKDNFQKISNSLRSKKGLKYPVSKLILVEGITEEILLPIFAKKLGFDFDKEGIYVLGAGGKSKVPALYSQYKYSLNIPILMLLDNDASQIYELVKNNLSKKDSIILINKGEFEDIISKNLIKRSINANYYDIEPVRMFELNFNTPMCENIHYIFKSRGLREFQKAHFAKVLADNVKYKSDVSSEIEQIIETIKKL